MNDESTYTIYRIFARNSEHETIKEGLTLEEAKEHCSDPETSSLTATSEESEALTKRKGHWFDSWVEE